jgi:hypothetical protein
MRGAYESMPWAYYSSGRNCDPTAHQATLAGAIKNYTSESSIFCGLVDSLSRAGHWGISQLFRSILYLLLPDDNDDERYAR